MQGFAERLNQVIGGNRQIASFARSSGVHEANLRKYLDGRVPGLDKVVQIASAAGVSVDWLATGQEARDSSHVMRQEIGGTQQEQAGGQMLHGLSNQQSRGNDFVMLPRYDVRASAGQGVVNTTEEVNDFVAFDRSYLRSAGINPTHADVIQVEGRSMMPSFVDGEWVVVDRSSTRIVDDAIYAVIYGEGLFIKRLRREDDGSVILISDNKAEGYGDRVISGENLSSLTIVGRVRRHLRSL